MIDRGAFFVGWHIGQMMKNLRASPYYGILEKGILYIKKAPAKQTETVLSFAELGGE